MGRLSRWAQALGRGQLDASGTSSSAALSSSYASVKSMSWMSVPLIFAIFAPTSTLSLWPNPPALTLFTLSGASFRKSTPMGLSLTMTSCSVPSSLMKPSVRVPCAGKLGPSSFGLTSSLCLGSSDFCPCAGSACTLVIPPLPPSSEQQAFPMERVGPRWARPRGEGSLGFVVALGQLE
eukprot:CAMPEP_0197889716 /NCGR_PEP_ID=MMETSP1439-20131203/24486_1 /TAXON_ID=66791 /ORGANISM="Gonyaulax spinifera, Strain CCMP409" /LENGTH=178 /DNA_ID=CAMNT_0043509701 /DNA_START=169 /DNA_END=702 /DNA_ORIENTATION=-